MNDASQPQLQPQAQSQSQPSILFASPMNVLDITSGASLSMRTLLAALAARGFRAVALQATLFDSTHGGEHVLHAGEEHKDKKLLRAQVLGVEHLIVRTQAARRDLMTCGEQEIYLRRFREELRDRRPDMIILWGGLLLEMTVMREAREAGIPVVFYLVNSGYRFKETFKYVSVIVTDTQATADMYQERHGFTCHPIGKFIDVSLIKAAERKPGFITFINPSFEKGVNVFMPLARLAARECPEIKFLVVESRGRWGNALKAFKFPPRDFPNVKIIGHQRDMRPVYGNTRAVLLPSTWYESGARVIAESLLNGIPVLASNTGGSSELVGKGGVMFDLPEVVREKKMIAAGEEVVRPWLEEIKRIVHDEAHYRQLCRHAEKEAEQHDIQHNTDRLLQAVMPVVQASKARTPSPRPAPSSPTPAPLASSSLPSADGKSVLKKALEKKQAKQARRQGRAR